MARAGSSPRPRLVSPVAVSRRGRVVSARRGAATVPLAASLARGQSPVGLPATIPQAKLPCEASCHRPAAGNPECAAPRWSRRGRRPSRRGISRGASVRPDATRVHRNNESADDGGRSRQYRAAGKRRSWPGLANPCRHRRAGRPLPTRRRPNDVSRRGPLATPRHPCTDGDAPRYTAPRLPWSSISTADRTIRRSSRATSGGRRRDGRGSGGWRGGICPLWCRAGSPWYPASLRTAGGASLA